MPAGPGPAPRPQPRRREALEPVGAQEAVRHERIDAVIESTRLRGIYEVVEEFDFSSDETVSRPAIRIVS